MICFECAKFGLSREAVGLCHHCSAALCPQHARTMEDPVTATCVMFKPTALPKHARLILCSICRDALEQSHEVLNAAKE
jgi:hypothetical protein